MIFDGISSSYSEIYERQLSHLYGSHVEVIVKKLGDEFDEETCYADGMIVTHDKLQHGKILKMLTFGIRDTDNNYMEKKKTNLGKTILISVITLIILLIIVITL